MQKECATLLALNKWDVGRTDLEDATARAQARLRQRPRGAGGVREDGPRASAGCSLQALELADRANVRDPRPPSSTASCRTSRPTREPPVVRGKRLKLLYMTQYETRPPRFSVQVSDRGRLTRDYGFLIENRLRERYGLHGVPLVIDYHGREEKRGR